MFICSLIKSVFVILFVFVFPHCSVLAFATFSKEYRKKHNILYAGFQIAIGHWPKINQNDRIFFGQADIMTDYFC